MKTRHLAIALAALAVPAAAADPAPGPKERRELVKLYEEEVLAHDLYVELGTVHPDIMPFRNIPRSEAAHREAMAAVLARHGIEVPEASGKRRFVTKGLDKLFRDWLAEGRRSEADACRVGVRLEEQDIADLRAAQQRFPEAKEVLSNLEQASGNHLRAFHRNLVGRGGAYQPTVLAADDFGALIGAGHAGGCAGGGCTGCDQPGCRAPSTGRPAAGDPQDTAPRAEGGNGPGPGGPRRRFRGGRGG